MNVAVHSQPSALSVHPSYRSQQIGRILCQLPSSFFSSISELFARSSHLAHSTVLTRLVILFTINNLRTIVQFSPSLFSLNTLFSSKSELFSQKHRGWG